MGLHSAVRMQGVFSVVSVILLILLVTANPGLAQSRLGGMIRAPKLIPTKALTQPWMQRSPLLPRAPAGAPGTGKPWGRGVAGSVGGAPPSAGRVRGGAGSVWQRTKEIATDVLEEVAQQGAEAAQLAPPQPATLVSLAGRDRAFHADCLACRPGQVGPHSETCPRSAPKPAEASPAGRRHPRPWDPEENVSQ